MKTTKKDEKDKNCLHRYRPEALEYQKEQYGCYHTGMLRMSYQRLYVDKQSCHRN
jgi:hypothetical protein